MVYPTQLKQWLQLSPPGSDQLAKKLSSKTPKLSPFSRMSWPSLELVDRFTLSWNGAGEPWNRKKWPFWMSKWTNKEPKNGCFFGGGILELGRFKPFANIHAANLHCYVHFCVFSMSTIYIQRLLRRREVLQFPIEPSLFVPKHDLINGSSPLSSPARSVSCCGFGEELPKQPPYGLKCLKAISYLPILRKYMKKPLASKCCP